MFFRLKAYAAAIGAFLVALWAAWFMGKREARREAREDALQDHIDTRKRIDEVTPSDEHSSREWLRKRGDR